MCSLYTRNINNKNNLYKLYRVELSVGIEGMLVQDSPQTESPYVVCLSKTLYPLLSTGSTQEDPTRHA